MSLRLEMLQVARLAPRVLGESAVLVRDYLKGRQGADGGFLDRSGRSDLYYTVFGVEGLLALAGGELKLEFGGAPALRSYLESHGNGEGLDMVHLACLARAWAGLETLERDAGRRVGARPLDRVRLGEAMEAYRSEDGGYHAKAGSKHGTAYGCFLGLGVRQDLGLDVSNREGILACLEGLRAPEGAWGNERGLKQGATNATAAAIAVMRALGAAMPGEAGSWLLAQAHPQGGFKAMPSAPMPDLLSTATALHALSGLQVPLGRLKEGCLDFVDTLWTSAGGFHGHWADDELDVEYTYYGLLALGHLSVA